MNITHLNDESLQNFIWDKSVLRADELQHIAGCVHCRSKIEDYRLLFQAVEDSPKPSFDFDLAAMVIPRLEQLQQSKLRSTKIEAPLAENIVASGMQARLPLRGSKSGSWSAIAAMLAAILFIAVPLYFFRDDVMEIVTNASVMITWLIVMMIALIAVFVGIDEFRKYGKRLDSLDTQ